MSFAAGFPAIFNEKTQTWTEIYIGTKASEVFFADGQTFEEKLNSGQLQGRDGADGKDGITTTVIVPGTTEWLYIDDIVTDANGSDIFNKNLKDGATFIKFTYRDSNTIEHRCYGYWAKEGDLGCGVAASWDPDYGMWQMFGTITAALVTERVYPIDKTVWIPVGNVSIITGGHLIHQKLLNDGFACFTAKIAGQNGFGWWLRNETEGSGFFFDTTNNVYLIWKDNVDLKGKLISQGTQSTVIKEFETCTWKELKVSTITGGRTLRSSTAQGFNCVKAEIDGIRSFGWWLNYGSIYGVGLFMSYSVRDIDIWIGYSLGEDILHRFSIFGADTGDLNVSDLHSIVSKAKMSVTPQDISGTSKSTVLDSLLDLNEGANVIRGTFDGNQGTGIWFNEKGMRNKGAGLLFGDKDMFWISGNSDGLNVQKLFTIPQSLSDAKLCFNISEMALKQIHLNVDDTVLSSDAAIFDDTKEGFNAVRFVLVTAGDVSMRCHGFWNRIGTSGAGLFSAEDGKQPVSVNSCWAAVKTGAVIKFSKIWPVNSATSSFSVVLKDIGEISESRGKDINKCLFETGIHVVKVNVSGKDYTGTWLKLNNRRGFGYFVDDQGNPYTFTKIEGVLDLVINPIQTTDNGFKKNSSVLEITGDTSQDINFVDIMADLDVGEYVDLTATLLHEGSNLVCQGSFIKMTDRYGSGILHNSINQLRFSLSVLDNKGKFTLL